MGVLNLFFQLLWNSCHSGFLCWDFNTYRLLKSLLISLEGWNCYLFHFPDVFFLSPLILLSSEVFFRGLLKFSIEHMIFFLIFFSKVHHNGSILDPSFSNFYFFVKSATYDYKFDNWRIKKILSDDINDVVSIIWYTMYSIDMISDVDVTWHWLSSLLKSC